MKITTYRELQSKDELLPLWWPFNPREFEKVIKVDRRLQNNPVGYVAIEDDQAVGFAGIMDIDTRILEDSQEKVGGIWGVVTHPAYARRGISTTLMQKCHEYFRKGGYKFSLLNTSKSLVAYAFYQKLGYRDVTVYPSVYKVIIETKTSTKKTREKVELNWKKILTIYNQATKGLTGFVIRDRQYGRMLEARKTIQPEKCIVTPKGYALLSDTEGSITVQELTALTKEEISKLITQVEARAKKTVVDQAVLDENLQKTYQSHGFMMLEDSYNVLMYKSLTDTTFAETYGNKFYATAADFF